MTSAQADNLRAALQVGYHLLDRGVGALTAVEHTICVLEASGLFNAGRGARLQLDGVRRMDASLMEGHALHAGAVASVEGIVHPITAARLVMEHTNHVMLVGRPAAAFARFFGLKRQPASRIKPAKRVRLAQWLSPAWLKMYRSRMRNGLAVRKRAGQETVGAVALDRAGTVAAGASTGGVDVMLPGRVGDTPLIGCGVYADNKGGAVAMTGLGEGIIRVAVAKEICDRLAAGAGPRRAARGVLRKLVTRVAGAAGTLVLSPDGRFAVTHVTPRMAAGWWNGRGDPTVGDDFR